MPRAASLPITIRELTKTYGKVVSLDRVDLDIRSGEFLTLLGPSGSGKTTLLTVVAGFTRPDSGSVKFGGVEMVRTPPHKRGVGMVFQNYALFPHMSVAANVAFPLRLRGVPRPEQEQRVERALEMVRLAGYGARGVDQLSGGQRQRVALARAMVFEPRILLMDEPLSALDKQLREQMQIELRQLHEQLGMTTVYVTHDQREALTMSDRIAVIDHGRIMQLDAPRRIYDHPANRFVASFIGESTFLRVSVSAGVAWLGARPLTLGEIPARDGRYLLMLRPERVHLLASDRAADVNVLHGKVTAVVYQGDSTLLQIRLDDGAAIGVRTASAREAGDATLRAGDDALLGLAPEDTVLLPEDTTP
jgi:putative spermidine/putrescine transport system ATP-binding protein